MATATVSKRIRLNYVDHPDFHDHQARHRILESLPHVDASAGPASNDQWESSCFLLMNCLKFLAEERRNRSALNPLADSDQRAASSLEASARTIRDQIAVANLRVVKLVVRSLTQLPDLREELEGDGYIILLRTIEHFDVQYGFKFATYASAALKRELRRIMFRRLKDRSLVQSSSELEPAAQPTRTPDFCAEEIAKAREFLDSLPEREREILKWRYGFYNNDAITSYRRLADRFGVSGERLRQIVERTCSKARKQFRLSQIARLGQVALD